jgi:hypothetical protein
MYVCIKCTFWQGVTAYELLWCAYELLWCARRRVRLGVCIYVYVRTCARVCECVCVCRVGAMGESVGVEWESGGHDSKLLTGQDGVYVLALERSRQSPPGMTFV